MAERAAAMTPAEIRALFGSVFGLKIIESVHMTKELRINRTWKERLFTSPWRPWCRFSVICVPLDYALIFGDNGLLCHPEFARKIREALATPDAEA